MTFEQAKAERDQLEAKYREAGVALRAFPRNGVGLASDSAMATPEYRQAKARVDKAFAALRAFNAGFTKVFGGRTK